MWAFSARIFSRVPINSKCDVPMVVITPQVGFTTLAIRAISPGILTPISMTAAVCSGSIWHMVMGTPTWLLALPRVL